jgi:hypothetical protein
VPVPRGMRAALASGWKGTTLGPWGVAVFVAEGAA